MAPRPVPMIERQCARDPSAPCESRPSASESCRTQYAATSFGFEKMKFQVARPTQRLVVDVVVEDRAAHRIQREAPEPEDDREPDLRARSQCVRRDQRDEPHLPDDLKAVVHQLSDSRVTAYPIVHHRRKTAEPLEDARHADRLRLHEQPDRARRSSTTLPIGESVGRDGEDVAEKSDVRHRPLDALPREPLAELLGEHAHAPRGPRGRCRQAARPELSLRTAPRVAAGCAPATARLPLARVPAPGGRFGHRHAASRRARLV